MAIFFYWVSFGNFAGMLALAVTTFGLIGKLFSEAIENIDPGPLEAITATGATRLQAIVYGILPQIVPPFVSYSIYQWDINVRMATIVGFAGGGGIGLLLYNDYFPFGKYRSAGTAVAAHRHRGGADGLRQRQTAGEVGVGVRPHAHEGLDYVIS